MKPVIHKILRISPSLQGELSPDDQEIIQIESNETKMTIQEVPSKPKVSFPFEHIFYKETESNYEIFKEFEYLIETLFNGTSVKIITFGPCASGKRFTLFGPSIEENQGIIFLFLKKILEKTSKDQSICINIEFEEIRKRKRYDLIKEVKGKNKVLSFEDSKNILWKAYKLTDQKNLAPGKNKYMTSHLGRETDIVTITLLKGGNFLSKIVFIRLPGEEKMIFRDKKNAEETGKLNNDINSCLLTLEDILKGKIAFHSNDCEASKLIAEEFNLEKNKGGHFVILLNLVFSRGRNFSENLMNLNFLNKLKI